MCKEQPSPDYSSTIFLELFNLVSDQNGKIMMCLLLDFKFLLSTDY